MIVWPARVEDEFDTVPRASEVVVVAAWQFGRRQTESQEALRLASQPL